MLVGRLSGGYRWKPQRLSGVHLSMAMARLACYRRRGRCADRRQLTCGHQHARFWRALASLFRGAVSKETVSRVWRKMNGDCEAWNKRDLSTKDIIRLILDGTTVRVLIDREETTISCLPFAAWAERAAHGAGRPGRAWVEEAGAGHRRRRARA